MSSRYEFNEFFGPAQQAVLEMKRLARGADVPLDPKEEESLRRRAAAFDEAFKEELRPKFKIEFQFGKGKSGRTHFPGLLMVYRSGSALGGGADEVVYPCPSNDCLGYIFSENISSQKQFAFCPTCNVSFHQSELKELRYYRLPMEKWAEVAEKEFLRCGSMADVVMKTRKSDIRISTEKEQEGKNQPGLELYKSRSDRVTVVYRLEALVRDMAGGSDVYSRMLAFLRA